MIDPGYAVRLVQRAINVAFSRYPWLHQPHLAVDSIPGPNTRRDLRWAAWLVLGLRDGDWTSYVSDGQLPRLAHPINWWPAPAGPHISGYPLTEFCQFLQHPPSYWNHHHAAYSRHRDRLNMERRQLGGPVSPVLPGDGLFGVDFASDGQGAGHELAADGVRFCARYLSTYGPKNLHRAEADDYSRHGIDNVVVWETTADRALDGSAAGRADAIEADRQARSSGQPHGRPIYFAVDFDAEGDGLIPSLFPYFDGVRNAIGRERAGIYAGFGPVEWALSAGMVDWAWQTYAWSGGRWYDRAQLRQYSNDHVLAGLSVDYDHAHHRDYGGWRSL